MDADTLASDLTAGLNAGLPESKLLSRLTKAVLDLEKYENIPEIYEVQGDLLDIILELREQRATPRSTVKLVNNRRRQAK